MPKTLRDGVSYNYRDIVEILHDFSRFKDRVEKKYKDLAGELSGKANQHSLWVHLYLISTDYAEEAVMKAKRETNKQLVPNLVASQAGEDSKTASTQG